MRKNDALKIGELTEALDKAKKHIKDQEGKIYGLELQVAELGACLESTRKDRDRFQQACYRMDSVYGPHGEYYTFRIAPAFLFSMGNEQERINMIRRMLVDGLKTILKKACCIDFLNSIDK